MHSDLVAVLVLLGAAIAMFVIGRPRIDAVALIMIVSLPATGVITINEALAGFSDPAVVLIAALFVLGEGLVRTGVAQSVGDWLVATSGSSETRLLVLLMVSVGVMGSIMSSTAVVAIFIPVALHVVQKTGTPASRLMMPMSVAGLISGMMTLVATAPNLVVNSELMRIGEQGFGFFTFTPIGAPVLALGIAYMVVARRRLGSSTAARRADGPTLHDWVAQYGLQDRAFRLSVERSSPLVGETLGSLGLHGAPDAHVIAVERFQRFKREVLRALSSTEVRAGDILLVDVDAKGFDIDALCERFALQRLPMAGTYFTDQSRDVGMAEAIVPVDSHLVGMKPDKSPLLMQHGLSVVGLRRGRVTHDHGLESATLKIGDTLLLVGPWAAFRALRKEGHDLIALSLPVEGRTLVPVPDRAPHAIACLLLVLILMVTGVLPYAQSVLIGCLLMGLFRCIDLDSAYRAINWRTLILIVGMLPFALALKRTGGMDLGADAMLALVGTASIRAVLATVFAMTALIGLAISNTATAVLMAPVAVALANHLHASPYPFGMMVALGASSAFATPISPVNTLVSTFGNYSLADFVKVGAPFTLVVMAVSVLLVPWLLPAY